MKVKVRLQSILIYVHIKALNKLWVLVVLYKKDYYINLYHFIIYIYREYKKLHEVYLEFLESGLQKAKEIMEGQDLRDEL